MKENFFERFADQLRSSWNHPTTINNGFSPYIVPFSLLLMEECVGFSQWRSEYNFSKEITLFSKHNNNESTE